MRVVWTRGAGAQLQAAYRYLAKESPQAAVGFLDAVEQVAADLRRFPEAGYRTDQPGVRSLPIRRYRYRVYYQVAPDAVRIIRIRHTSRQPSR